MSKLKVGDRVRVYGYSTAGEDYTFKTGRIFTKDVKDEFCQVELYTDRPIYPSFHLKQLRKLKPKKPPREFWVVRYGGIDSLFSKKLDAESHARSLISGITEKEVIHVREVREKSE